MHSDHHFLCMYLLVFTNRLRWKSAIKHSSRPHNAENYPYMNVLSMRFVISAWSHLLNINRNEIGRKIMFYGFCVLGEACSRILFAFPIDDLSHNDWHRALFNRSLHFTTNSLVIVHLFHPHSAHSVCLLFFFLHFYFHLSIEFWCHASNGPKQWAQNEPKQTRFQCPISLYMIYAICLTVGGGQRLLFTNRTTIQWLAICLSPHYMPEYE